MNKIEAIIVDDEQSARDVLSNLLGRDGSMINVIGTSSNSHKKIKALVFGLELRLKIKWLLVNEVVCFLFSLHQGLSTVCTTFLFRHLLCLPN